MGALGLAVGIFHYLGLYLQLGAASRPPPWDAPAEGSGEREHRAGTGDGDGGGAGDGRRVGRARGSVPAVRLPGARRSATERRRRRRRRGPGGRGGAGFRQHGALRRGGGSAERGRRIGAALRRSVPSASAAGRGAAPSASRAPPHASRSGSAVSPRGSFRPLALSVPADPPEERPEDGAGISVGSRHHGSGRCPAPRGAETPTDRGCSWPSGVPPGPGSRWWGRAGAGAGPGGRSVPAPWGEGEGLRPVGWVRWVSGMRVPHRTAQKFSNR